MIFFRRNNTRVYRNTLKMRLVAFVLFLIHSPYLFFHILKQSFDRQKPIKDTLFIFGSGYSINDISDKDWKKIRKTADTLSFNYFFRCNKINMDYHIVREVDDAITVKQCQENMDHYLQQLYANPRYKKVCLLVCFLICFAIFSMATSVTS